MSETRKDTELTLKINTIADHYGKDAQIDQALEELAELATALHHLKKKPESKDIMDNVHEEMADVYIMINQLIHLIDPELKTMVWMQHKVDRQIGRIYDGRN